jgi:hypothetical protein
MVAAAGKENAFPEAKSPAKLPARPRPRKPRRREKAGQVAPAGPHALTPEA